jgi:hypothetical protein
MSSRVVAVNVSSSTDADGRAEHVRKGVDTMTAATTLRGTGHNGITLGRGTLVGLLGGAVLVGALIGAAIQFEVGMGGVAAQARPLAAAPIQATVQRAQLAAGNGPLVGDGRPGAGSTPVLVVRPPWMFGPPSDGFGFPRPTYGTTNRAAGHAAGRGPVER